MTNTLYLPIRSLKHCKYLTNRKPPPPSYRSSHTAKPPPQRRPDNPHVEHAKAKCAASQGIPHELDRPAKIEHITTQIKQRIHEKIQCPVTVNNYQTGIDSFIELRSHSNEDMYTRTHQQPEAIRLNTRITIRNIG